LPLAIKRELGRLVLDLLPKRKLEALRPALLWTLGRLGARQPLYGPLNTVLDRAEVQRWLERIWEVDELDATASTFAVMLLARRTGDRYRDLDDEIRERAIGWLEIRNSPRHLVDLVANVGRLDEVEQGRLFGESLPKGLRLS